MPARQGGPESWSPLDILEDFDRAGRFAASPAAMLDGLSRALADVGAHLVRSRFTFEVLHPLLRVLTVKWWPGAGASDELGSLHGLERQAQYVGSPVEAVFTHGRPFRRRLDALDPGRDHRVLFAIREEGGTDYLAAPIRFAGPIKGMFAIVTGDPKGFAPRHVEDFPALCDRIAPALEALIHRRIATTLLETYVGRRSGARVLEGQIKRGDAEAVTAAFWYSDLFDFTHMTETGSIESVLSVVNRHVEIAWAEARPRGGEIVSLVGDGLLMMFPVEGADQPADVCASALAAARAAQAEADGDRSLRFGIGLHFGTAIYGNIGAPDRLDFTVMGAAVNRTARLEALTRELNRPILASGDFIAQIDVAAESCGSHRVKGVDAPLEVFAPGPVRA